MEDISVPVHTYMYLSVSTYMKLPERSLLMSYLESHTAGRS